MSALQQEMRVLFVHPRMVAGGVERVLLNLIREFQGRGAKCMLALRRCYGEFAAEACQLVQVEEIGAGGMHQFVPSLSQLIRRWRPTHILTAFPDVAILALMARWFAGSQVPILHGVHNTHGAEAAVPTWGGRLRHRLNNLLARIVYRKVDAVVPVSQSLGDELASRYGVPWAKLRVIYNPVVSEALLRPCRERETSAADEFRIVCLGRLTHQKGFDFLLAAMAQVGSGPLRPWHLKIFGEGAERPNLQRVIDDAALNSRVTLCGYTADPACCLHEADLFVLPSRHEGLPTVLIEALASGVEIIATDCRHGPREILLDGKLGRLVSVGDVDELAEAIAKAIDGLRIGSVEARRKRAEDFTVPESARQWLRLLAETSCQHAAPGG